MATDRKTSLNHVRLEGNWPVCPSSSEHQKAFFYIGMLSTTHRPDLTFFECYFSRHSNHEWPTNDVALSSNGQRYLIACVRRGWLHFGLEHLVTRFAFRRLIYKWARTTITHSICNEQRGQYEVYLYRRISKTLNASFEYGAYSLYTILRSDERKQKENKRARAQITQRD